MKRKPLISGGYAYDSHRRWHRMEDESIAMAQQGAFLKEQQKLFEERFLKACRENPDIGSEELGERFGISASYALKLAKKHGFELPQGEWDYIYDRGASEHSKHARAKHREGAPKDPVAGRGAKGPSSFLAVVDEELWVKIWKAR